MIKWLVHMEYKIRAATVPVSYSTVVPCYRHKYCAVELPYCLSIYTVHTTTLFHDTDFMTALFKTQPFNNKGKQKQYRMPSL